MYVFYKHFNFVYIQNFLKIKLFILENNDIFDKTTKLVQAAQSFQKYHKLIFLRTKFFTGLILVIFESIDLILSLSKSFFKLFNCM